MDPYLAVKEKLKELDISFELVEHEPVLTTEQADSFIEGIDGVRTKTMFLTNKKKTAYYLLIMDDKKMLDMCFHPNTNEKTLFLDTKDILRFLEDIGYTPHIIEL